MKIIYFILFLCPFIVKAQFPDWNAKFVITNPDGLTDTVFIGCNSVVDIGYQNDFDLLDTDLPTPVGIRSYDIEVEDQLELGKCVNLKKDTRGFVNEGIVEFTLILSSDEYPDADNLTISWDTSDFNYNESGLRITYAFLQSELGYINGIDGMEFYFFFVDVTATDTQNIFTQSIIPLYPFDSIPECSSGNWAMKVHAFIAFNIYPVDIEQDFNYLHIFCYPNPVRDYLIIKNTFRNHLALGVYDLNGALLIVNQISGIETSSFDLSSLSSGVYFLKCIEVQSGRNQTFQIIKN